MSPAKRTPQRTQRPAGAAPETVDPAWLVRALVISLAAALLCAWLTACLLFYQGAWQLVLYPSHTVDRTPQSIGLAFTSVRFGDFSTGQPHLTGWWIPSAPTASASSAESDAATVLYLHGGSGSLADTLPILGALHSAGVNIFALDYRGFGLSDSSAHPDADRMAEDAAAALGYLTATRHIAPSMVVPMGSGLGASLAVRLAQDHGELPAVILDNPDPDPAATAAAARPSKVIPVRLLFGGRFEIAAPLAHLTTRKLLIGGPLTDEQASLNVLYQTAAPPKSTVTLSPAQGPAALTPAIHTFVNQIWRTGQ